MCRTRLHTHACGHSRVSVLSACRFTYTSHTSAPLCQSTAAPDLVVRLPSTCHACEYSTFVSAWQKRIDDFAERCANLRTLIADVSARDCCELDDGPSDDEPAYDLDFPHEAAERARREYTVTYSRYEGLRREFNAEHETRWPSHAKGRIGFVKSARADELKRRRSTSGAAPRPGPSPLRWATTPAMETVTAWDADEGAITDSESECELLSMTDGDSDESAESIRTGRSASADSLTSTALVAAYDAANSWLDKAWAGDEPVFEAGRRASDVYDDDSVDPAEPRHSLNKEDLARFKTDELKQTTTSKWLTETEGLAAAFKSMAWSVVEMDEIDLPNYGF